MLGRFLCGAALLLVGGGLCGCFDAVEGQVDEQKNPYFIHGRERATARDYKGAIDAFEKALEVNPHSALAHFELGVLYEQHDEEEDHFISAVYHYKRAMDLRPNAYPAGNAKERIAVCKRELVKVESFAPDYQLLERELDKLKDENLLLHKQFDPWLTQSAGRPPAPAGSVMNQNQFGPATPRSTSLPFRNDLSTTNGGAASVANRSLPPANGATLLRTHTIKAGETLAAVARQYKIKLDTLLAANPTVDPRRLRVGQAVNLPST